MPISEKRRSDIREMGDDFKRATYAIEMRRYDLAIEILQRVLSTQPENSFALYTLGRAYTLKQMHVQAMGVLKDALRLDPSHSAAHMLYGALLKDASQYQQAEEEMLMAIQLDPSNHRAYYIYADLLLIHKKAIAAAREYLAKALELDPADVSYHELLGQIFIAEGDLVQAEVTYRHALSLEPENGRVHNSYGAFLFNYRCDPRKAFEHFRIALTHDPDNAATRKNFQLAAKAKHKVYGFVWHPANLRTRRRLKRLFGRWYRLVVFGIMVFVVGLWFAAMNNPALMPFVVPVVLLYILFYIYICREKPLFKFLSKHG